jgi:dihydroorotate dehydrogenase electron transfer subunit
MEPYRRDCGIFLARVQRRRELCKNHFELTLAATGFPSARPGQFIQVLCRPPDAEAAPAPSLGLLRRPFSIAGMRRSGADIEIALIARVIGPGTAWLDARDEGDQVSILGPLGTAFSLPAAGERALLVAGGVGIPPIRWMGEFLRKSKVECACIYGVQTRNLLPLTLQTEPSQSGEMTDCVAEFAREGIPASITTDDGSCGLRGRVTDAVGDYLKAAKDPAALRVYACGPELMLRAVAELCQRHGAACEVALERVMGCGMATCQSCVVPIVDLSMPNGWKYALCCRDGPVFDARCVAW